MSEPEIFEMLRGLLTTHNIRKLAKEVGISHMKLHRFKKNNRPLSLADAEKLCIKLTGKTFIVAPDA